MSPAEFAQPVQSASEYRPRCLLTATGCDTDRDRCFLRAVLPACGCRVPPGLSAPAGNHPGAAAAHARALELDASHRSERGPHVLGQVAPD